MHCRSQKHEPGAELGVCLGYSSHIEGDYLFLVANNEVVSRRTVTPTQCAPPHGWLIQKVWLAELRTPAVFTNRIDNRDG